MRKKIVIRIDDVGYTIVNNMGAFQTIKNGLATAADVMLDTPGTEDALKKLRNYPWISVGWHTHFWGSPFLDLKEVPTLIDSKTGHFRSDIKRSNEINYNEIVAEMRAQMERCVHILGKAPDTADSGFFSDTPFSNAKMKICREFGIVTNFASRVKNTNNGFEFSDVNKKWAKRKIYILDPHEAYKDLFSDSFEKHAKYDPVKYYVEDRGKISMLPEGCVAQQSWHPGWVDYYMCRCGDRGQKARNFLECRPIDVHALCSEELKNWVRDNNYELVNLRDALYGTQEYQNHLRITNSNLCVL